MSYYRLDSSSLCSSSSRHDALSMGGSSSYTGGPSSRATSHRQLDVDCSSIHSGHNGHPIPSPSNHSHTPVCSLHLYTYIHYTFTIIKIMNRWEVCNCRVFSLVHSHPFVIQCPFHRWMSLHELH